MWGGKAFKRKKKKKKKVDCPNRLYSLNNPKYKFDKTIKMYFP